MATATPLLASEVKTKAMAMTVNQKFIVHWRMPGDATMYMWHGTVREVLTDWVLVIYDEAPDPLVQYSLPYQAATLEYFRLEAEGARTGGDMLQAARARASLFSVIEWRPLTWGHMLHPENGDRLTTKALLMNELKSYFGLVTRAELTLGSTAYEYELVTLYEALLAWVSFASICSEWKTPAILALVEPILHRCCALRRASPYRDEKRRGEAINQLTEAWVAGTSTSRDRVSEIMARPLGKPN